MPTAFFFHMRSGARALRRDWDSGELRLLILALMIAVAAVTSVGFLADRVGRALERDSAQMLGGDLALQADEPIPSSFISQSKTLGLDTALTLQFPSMAGKGPHNQLVALKAVSTAYPLRGQLRVSGPAAGDPAAGEPAPGEPVAGIPAAGVAVAGVPAMVGRAPSRGTVWVDGQVLGLLSASVGDAISVGDADFRIAGVIVHEPDRGMQFVNVAPRVMLAMEDLPQTGLVGTGSRVSYQLLVAGAPDAVSRYKSWLQDHMQRGQKLSTLETNRPEVQRALNRAHQFLILVALLTVMIAAVAVALAARRFGVRHQDGIAIMRCLGASKHQLGMMLWVEFLLLAVLASAVGSAVGYIVHEGLVSIVVAWLDTELPSPSVMPALQGLVTGSLLLLGFALPPLAALRAIAPARVLRRDAGLGIARQWPGRLLGMASFFGLILWIAGDLRLSVVVAAGFLVALLLFAAVAHLLVSLLGLLRYRSGGHPALRFAVAGMARRRSLTVAQLCALSMGLMILLLLAITRTDLLQGWQSTLPPDAPNTFLINIQPDQRASVTDALERAGVRAVAMSPMVRGRLLAINDRAVSAHDYQEARARRLVDREFNLSYTDTLPASNKMAEGRWLDPTKDEVSIESSLAEALGMRVGDKLTFDVAGRPVTVRISGLREVKWDSFQANFFALLSPAALRDAPATFMTSLHIPAAQRDLPHALVRAFPNLTVFDVGSILGQVQHVLDQVIQAVQLLFLFTLAAGMVVLGAAMFSTRDERMHEVAILRALGASRRQLSASLRIELLLLGALAGTLAAFGAVSVAWLLAREVFDFTLTLSWWPWAVGIAAGSLAALLGGRLALAGILRTPPLVSLREAA